MMSAGEKERAMRRLVEEGMNERDDAVVRETFAEEISLMGESKSAPPDRMVSELTSFSEAIPDFEIDVREVWTNADGEGVLLHYEVSGTFNEELRIDEGMMAGLEAEPTGETIAASGVFLARFDDGNITEWMNYSQTLQLYQQMGIVPGMDELTS